MLFPCSWGRAFLSLFGDPSPCDPGWKTLAPLEIGVLAEATPFPLLLGGWGRKLPDAGPPQPPQVLASDGPRPLQSGRTSELAEAPLIPCQWLGRLRDMHANEVLLPAFGFLEEKRSRNGQPETPGTRAPAAPQREILAPQILPRASQPRVKAGTSSPGMKCCPWEASQAGYLLPTPTASFLPPPPSLWCLAFSK